MQIKDFREEKFGYAVIGTRGEVCLATQKAKDHLRVGAHLDENEYKPTVLTVNDPFRLEAPLIVMLEVTRQCNLTCGHCYISAGEPRENEMDTETIYKVLDELKKLKVFTIFITGGEPFLRSDITDIINYAEKCNFTIQIVTNGTLLTDTVLSQIRNRESMGFGISYLGGLDNGFSDDEAFSLLKEKVKLLKKYNFNVSVWFCVTKLNIDKMYEVGEWCLQNGVWPAFQSVMSNGRCREHPFLALDVSDVEAYVKGLCVYDDNEHTDIASKEKAKDYKNVFDICYALEFSAAACKGGRTFAYICSNGDVYPCSNCAGEDLFRAGNLYDSTLSDIWKKSFQDMRAFTWNDFKGCETCELNASLGENQFCKLRCAAVSKALYDDPLYCGATEYTKAISKHRFAWVEKYKGD